MKKTVIKERRYLISPEELAKKLGLEGKVLHIKWNDLEPGIDPVVGITTTELLKSDL